MQTTTVQSRWIPAPPDAKYIPCADGVRSISIFLIAWYHIYQLSWLFPEFTLGSVTVNLTPFVRTGYLYVDIMLMLSGFLLFLPVARQLLLDGPGESFSAFYWKRFKRIFPSYLFCLAVMLFGFALPRGLYSSPAEMMRDIFSHLTFTHIFSPYTYFNTRLNGILWTLAVEVQFYLLFPLIAAAFRKNPLATYLGMVLIAFSFRGWVQLNITDTTIWVNQLPAMLDVYANGMMAAFLYVYLAKKLRPGALSTIISTVLSGLLIAGICAIQIHQNSISGFDAVRLSQMDMRYILSLFGALLIPSLAYSVRCLQFLFSNRIMHFFSGISFNFYIWHQFLAAKLRDEWHIPPSISPTPHKTGEQPWQTVYTLLCFALAIALAYALTTLLERPASRGLEMVRRKAKGTKETRETKGTKGPRFS